MARKKFVQRHTAKQKAAMKEIEIKNVTPSTHELIDLLNWYRMYDPPRNVQKKWVIEFTGNKTLKKVDDKKFDHPMSSICRLATRGLVLTERNKKFIDEKLKIMLASIAVEEKTKEKPKSTGPTIQERIAEHANSLCADVDFLIDCKITKKEDGKLMPMFIANNLGKPQTNIIKKHIESYLFDYKKAFKDIKSKNDEDKEYAESYGTKQEIKKMIKFLEALVQESDRWMEAKTSVRKTRKKKEKTPEQLVKNVVLAEDSLPAENIIGKSNILVYNIQYGKLTLLSADVSLSVKGKTVINIDENRSKCFVVKSKFREYFHLALKDIKGIAKMRKHLSGNPSIFKQSKAKPTGRLSVKTKIVWIG